MMHLSFIKFDGAAERVGSESGEADADEFGKFELAVFPLLLLSLRRFWASLRKGTDWKMESSGPIYGNSRSENEKSLLLV